MHNQNKSLTDFLLTTIFLSSLIIISLISNIPNKTLAQTPLSTTNETYQFRISWGSNETDNGQFKTPIGIAIDSKGDVYVADTENDRVETFSTASSINTNDKSSISSLPASHAGISDQFLPSF